MKEISTIQEAEDYIFSYNWYESKSKNQDEEFQILKNCERLALQFNQEHLLCRARVYLTSYFTQVNDLQTALDTGLENYELAQRKNFTDELLMMLSFLTTIYQLLGNYSQAETYINICKDFVYRLNDKRKICNIHIVSANQYYYTGDMEKCIAAHENALQYARQLNDQQTIIAIYNNYGYHLIKSDPGASEEKLNSGLNLLQQLQKQNKKLDYFLGYYHLNYAVLYEKLTRDADAITSAIKAIKVFKKYNQQVELLESKVILSKALLNTEKFAASKKTLLEIESLALASSANRILLKCYEILYAFYEKKSKYKEAYTYLHKYLRINEAIYNEDSNKKIRNLQISNDVKAIQREKENAEAMARLKHDFLANMSHEIRTPINSILGICYLMGQETLTDNQKNYVSRLYKSGENLLGIINDVLDISKIEAGKFELLPTAGNITTTITDVHQVLLAAAMQKNIELKIQCDQELQQLEILYDAVRLSQVLINITANAIKFTQNGYVMVESKLEKQEDNIVWIKFRILDTGIGIAQHKLDKIFERYEQASANIKTQFGGTGLGLAISRKLVELMKGTMEVKSEENKGTEFIIHIPFTLSTEKISATEDITADISLLKDKYILIADDVEENRLVLKDLVRSFYQDILLDEAENGKQVLEKMEVKLPDLILMDLDMPELNGIDTAAHIRKNYPADPVKIIGNTASLISLSKEEILAMGFNDLLLKPFKPKELLSSIISCYQ